MAHQEEEGDGRKDKGSGTLGSSLYGKRTAGAGRQSAFAFAGVTHTDRKMRRLTIRDSRMRSFVMTGLLLIFLPFFTRCLSILVESLACLRRHTHRHSQARALTCGAGRLGWRKNRTRKKEKECSLAGRLDGERRLRPSDLRRIS